MIKSYHDLAFSSAHWNVVLREKITPTLPRRNYVHFTQEEFRKVTFAVHFGFVFEVSKLNRDVIIDKKLRFKMFSIRLRQGLRFQTSPV